MKAYRSPLTELHRELARWPDYSEEAAYLRSFIRHYQQHETELHGKTTAAPSLRVQPKLEDPSTAVLTRAGRIFRDGPPMAFTITTPRQAELTELRERLEYVQRDIQARAEEHSVYAARLRDLAHWYEQRVREFERVGSHATHYR